MLLIDVDVCEHVRFGVTVGGSRSVGGPIRWASFMNTCVGISKSPALDSVHLCMSNPPRLC